MGSGFAFGDPERQGWGRLPYPLYLLASRRHGTLYLGVTNAEPAREPQSRTARLLDPTLQLRFVFRQPPFFEGRDSHDGPGYKRPDGGRGDFASPSPFEEIHDRLGSVERRA